MLNDDNHDNPGSMKTKEEIINSLRKIKSELQKRFKLKTIALFGSYARDEQNKDSDVDVLVEVDPSIGLEFVSLAQAIENAVGLPTDVVSSRAVKPRYQNAIKSDLIYV